MARTRLQFYNYILRTFKRDDKDTEIYESYNETIRFLANKMPVGNLKYQSYITTTVAQEDYPLPASNCHIIHPVRFIKSSSQDSGYPLNKLTKEAFSARYPNPNISDTDNLNTHEPVDYCIYSGSLLVGPAPDKATYILEVDWAKTPTSQDADSDLQELGEDWEEVLKWGTLARLYEGIGLQAEADRFWLLFRDDEIGYPMLIRKEKDREDKSVTIAKNRSL